MKRQDTSGKGMVTTIHRDTRSGRLAETVSIPGTGPVRLVSDEAFSSAKRAASSRLKTAIHNVSRNKQD